MGFASFAYVFGGLFHDFCHVFFEVMNGEEAVAVFAEAELRATKFG